MEMIAFVKNEERAKDFAKEILRDLKLDPLNFNFLIKKISNNKFKIELKEKK